MTTTHDNHVTHLIDAYLAGGLDDAERTALEAHTIVCAACAAALESARQSDERLVELFTPIRPDGAFEQRLLAELRPAMAAPIRQRWRGRWVHPLVHPLVRRVAVGVAAAVVLGGVGFGMQRGMEAVEGKTALNDRDASVQHGYSVEEHAFSDRRLMEATARGEIKHESLYREAEDLVKESVSGTSGDPDKRSKSTVELGRGLSVNGEKSYKGGTNVTDASDFIQPLNQGRSGSGGGSGRGPSGGGGGHGGITAGKEVKGKPQPADQKDSGSTARAIDAQDSVMLPSASSFGSNIGESAPVGQTASKPQEGKKSNDLTPTATLTNRTHRSENLRYVTPPPEGVANANANTYSYFQSGDVTKSGSGTLTLQGVPDGGANASNTRGWYQGGAGQAGGGTAGGGGFGGGGSSSQSAGTLTLNGGSTPGGTSALYAPPHPGGVNGTVAGQPGAVTFGTMTTGRGDVVSNGPLAFGDTNAAWGKPGAPSDHYAMAVPSKGEKAAQAAPDQNGRALAAGGDTTLHFWAEIPTPAGQPPLILSAMESKPAGASTPTATPPVPPVLTTGGVAAATPPVSSPAVPSPGAGAPNALGFGNVTSSNGPVATGMTPPGKNELDSIHGVQGNLGGLQKDRTVADLTADARQLASEGKTKEAAGVVNKILESDPKNDYALGVRPLLEDKAAFQEQAKSDKNFDAHVSKKSGGADAKPGDYDDILRFPADWPDVSKGTAAGSERYFRPGETFGRSGKGTEVDGFKAKLDAKDGEIAAKMRESDNKTARLAKLPGDDKALEEKVRVLSDGSGKSANEAEKKDAALAEQTEAKAAADAQGKAVAGLEQRTGAQAGTPAAEGAPAGEPKAADTVKSDPEKTAKSEPAKPEPNKPETAKPENDTPPPEQPKPNDGPVVKPEPVPTPPRQPDAPIKAMVIRNGTLQFEVDSFDSALQQMNKIVGEEGGYLSGTSSDKLPNGKVRGVVTLRVPPERLDTLILKLRGMGDLKSQRVSADDVTKHFTDLNSQYRAAKAMEERLLAIIKAGGLVKDLLEAEKQLGVWREKIEVLEGEMRYIKDLVSMSTLTVELMERDVRTPTAASEQETVNTSVETEDVENARSEALKAIEAVKGRVLDSDLKKYEGGQLSATILAEVNPDSSGTVIDRLRQLGKLARLDISRKTTTQGGTGPIIPGLKVEKRETRLQISLYNLAQVAPRQMTTLNLAAPDVEAAYKTILEQVKGAGGRIVTSQLNRPKADRTVGTINFQVPSDKADVLLGAVRAGVEVMRMDVATSQDIENTTDAKRGFSVQINSLSQVPPREINAIQLAAAKVPEAFSKLMEAAKSGGGQIITSQLNEQDPNNITGTIEFEAMRDKMAAIQTALQEAGLIVTRNVTRSPDTEGTVDSKVRLNVTLIDDLRLAPRETISASVATATVQEAFSALVTAAKDSGARIVNSNLNLNDRSNPTGTLNFAVPRENAAKFETALKAAGAMISRTVNRQADGPMNVESKIGFAVEVIDELQLKPRETVSAVIASKQVPEAFNALANAARDAGARMVGSNLDLSDRLHPAGDLNFSIPKENREKFEAAMKGAGLLISTTVTRQQDGPRVADNKTGFSINVRDERTMQPRESQQMRVVTKSVTDRYNKLLETLRLMDAQVLQSRLVQERKDSTVGVLEFVIQRTDRAAIEKALSDNADVFDRTVQRSQDTQNTVDHRLLYSVELRDADQQKPRQIYDISLEAADIGGVATDLDGLAMQLGGKSLGSARTQEGNTEVLELAVDVPLEKREGMLGGVRSHGKVTSMQQRRDDDVPEGTLSRARVHVTLRPPPTVGAERGMGDSLRGGLNTGLNLLSAAAGYLVTGVIGLLIVVVLLMILWPIAKMLKRMRSEKPETPPSSGPGGTGGTGTPAPITPPPPAATPA